MYPGDTLYWPEQAADIPCTDNCSDGVIFPLLLVMLVLVVY